MMNKNYKTTVRLFLLLFMLIAQTTMFLPAVWAGQNIYGITGLIMAPVAGASDSVGGYSLNSQRYYMFSKTAFNGFAEFSTVKPEGGSEIYHYKLVLLEDGYAMPGVAFGVMNFRSSYETKTKYLAVSKSLPMLGLTLHAGYLDYGRILSTRLLHNYRDLPGEIARRADRDKDFYYGFEFSAFPLVGIMAERFDGQYNAGIRIRPIYGLNFDVSFLDLSRDLNLKSRRVYSFSYTTSF